MVDFFQIWWLVHAIHLIVEPQKKKIHIFSNLLPMLTVPTLKEFIWENLPVSSKNHSFTHLQGKDLVAGNEKVRCCGIGWDQLVIYNTG